LSPSCVSTVVPEISASLAEWKQIAPAGLHTPRNYAQRRRMTPEYGAYAARQHTTLLVCAGRAPPRTADNPPLMAACRLPAARRPDPVIDAERSIPDARESFKFSSIFDNLTLVPVDFPAP